MPNPGYIVEIRKPFGPPVAKAVSLPLLTSDEWQALDRVENLLLLDIGSGSGTAETHALIPTWEFGHDDTFLRDWTPVPPTEEAAEILSVQNSYVDEILAALGAPSTSVPNPALAILNVVVMAGGGGTKSTLFAAVAAALQVTEPSLPSDDDLMRVWELWFMLEDLSKHAFFEEKYNLFGDGNAGIYRSCSSPNIGARIRSNKKLDVDRPFTLWIHRAMPDSTQADPRFRIDWGDWALEFTRDRDVRFYKYNRELTAAQRSELLAQLRTAEDAGRINAATAVVIGQKQDEIATVKQEAKTYSRRPTPGENASITLLQADIATLKSEANGLEKAAEQAAQLIRESLFEKEEAVTFTDSLETYYGVDLPITFVPQRRGFVSIHLGHPSSRNYWVFEDETALEAGDWRSMWTATDGATGDRHPTGLSITTNGGAFWFRMSYPIVSRYCRLLSSTRRVDRDMTLVAAEDLLFVPSWDPIPAAWNSALRTWAGATSSVEVRVIPSTLTGDYGRFQWQLELDTDGAYMPVVYGAQLTIAATPRDREGETVLWSSVTDPGAIVGAEPRIVERGEAAGFRIELFDGDSAIRNAIGWTHNCQLWVYSIRAGRRVFTGMITTDPTTYVGQRAARLELDAIDRIGYVSRSLHEAETPGDGLTAKTYLEALLAEIGLHPEEINVAATPETLRTLPFPRPGEESAIRPEFGATRWEFLNAFVEGHLFKTEAYFDGEGVATIEAVSDTARPDIVFRQSHQFPGDRRVMQDVSEILDFSEFKNDFLVTGAEIPGGGGRRYSSRFSVYASVNDPDDIRYVGTWIMAPPIQDDSLRSQEQTDVAVRQQVELHGWPKWRVDFTTYYQDDLDPTTRFYIELVRDGVRALFACRIADITSANPGEDTMTLSVELILTEGIRKMIGR